MEGYIDLYILPLPKKNLNAYRKIASQFGKIIADLGALEYREFLGDDLKPKWATPFPSKIRLKPGEVLISSVVGFRSKKHRDQVNKKMMNDPRMKKLMAQSEKNPLMDMRLMCYGGFSTIVKM